MVYTSFVRMPAFENSAISGFLDSHAKTEQVIKDSGMAYTILQNGIYLEMIPLFAGEKVAETGVISFPAQQGKASWVLREELAEAAAYVLTTEGHENKSYVLTNSEATSFQGHRQGLVRHPGQRCIRYQSPPVEDFQVALKQFGLPDVYISMFTTWASAVAQGMMDVEDSTLASFLGRKPTTTAQFIAQVYN